MKKAFTKRGKYKTFDEYVLEKTGKTKDTINIDNTVYHINRLEKAAALIKYCIEHNILIVVHPDYDADGMTSYVNLNGLFARLGARYWIYSPMRHSGYGAHGSFIDLINNYPERGLLILIDNGIAAFEAVEKAKASGWQVLVLDHHLASTNDDGQIILPPADLIVDPEALPEGNTFVDYCGAGLAYKLAQMMLPPGDEMLHYIASYAAIGTIADVVSLTGDNRQIVLHGLWAMNNGHITPGLTKILEKANLLGHVTATGIAFNIAPMLNAAARLEDRYRENDPNFSGVTLATQALMSFDETMSAKYAADLSSINNERKELTNEVITAMNADELHHASSSTLIKVNAIDGILGPIASKVVEVTGYPALIYSQSGNICRGSARSNDDEKNHMKHILDQCSDLLISHGGHAGAAGFAFEANKTDALKERLASIKVAKSTLGEYDLVVKPEELISTRIEMDACEPFGRNFEAPVFKMDLDLTRLVAPFTMYGKNQNIKFRPVDGVEICCLNHATSNLGHKYVELGNPLKLQVIGKLSWNIFNGNKTASFICDDIALPD